MLLLKPNCECCDRDLAPDSPEARICSFECTFCAACVATRLGGVCPNCAGDFAVRPIRPARMLVKYPASTTRAVAAKTPPCASPRSASTPMTPFGTTRPSSA